MNNSSTFVNNLPIKSDNDILWEYNEKKNLYNKFVQIILEEEVKKEVKKEVKEKVKKEVVKKEEEIKEEVKEVKRKVVKKEEVKEVKRKVVKKEEEVKEVIKKKTLSPIDIIIDHCKSNIAAKDSIKQTLIETISRKDYIKIFGLKKSSEIMSGITKEKWNKSLVIFMSFLLDKQITYKGDIILYNAEKNNGNLVL